LTFENQPEYDEVGNRKTLDIFKGFEVPNERVVFKDQHYDLFFKSLWHDENPSTSGTRIARMVLSEASGRQLKVVLTGEGSDELFGGYPWYGVDKVCRPFSLLPKSIRTFMLLGPVVPAFKPWSSRVFLASRPMNLERFSVLVGTFGKENIMSDLFSDQMREQVLQSTDSYLNLTSFPDFQRWHNFEKIQYMETKTRLVDFIIHGLDRASMAYSLETRVPFLDHELVELCAHIPPPLKMKYLREKYILRKAMKEHLPPEILWRKKRGLSTPFKPWLMGNLPESIRDMISEEQLIKKGYFNASFVRHLLELHRAKKGNYTRALMVVLGVQVWDELFIKGGKHIEINGYTE
jgi:asparagine synthase (glutamine-hydrolysing)